MIFITGQCWEIWVFYVSTGLLIHDVLQFKKQNKTNNKSLTSPDHWILAYNANRQDFNWPSKSHEGIREWGNIPFFFEAHNHFLYYSF